MCLSLQGCVQVSIMEGVAKLETILSFYIYFMFIYLYFSLLLVKGLTVVSSLILVGQYSQSLI